MAGWKLRKDKAQAETPSTNSEAPALVESEEQTAPEDASHMERGEPETASLEPSDWLTNGWHAPSEEMLPVAELDPLPSISEMSPPQPDFEADDALHFVDDEAPLTLVDYSENEFRESAAPSIPAEVADFETVSTVPPVQSAISLFATPPVELSNQHSLETEESDSQSQTLRMNREEIAAAFPAPTLGEEIPVVAPFVLDTPLAAPTHETVHRLVVQIGRLSAPFELTKDIMVIARPDSNLQSYPDIEIEMDDAVSRRHAEVVKREDGYYVVDTGSTNGTMLNGATLPPHIEHRLTHGDRIRVGERTEIIFE